MISAEEARDATDLGRSYREVADPRARGGRRFETFPQFAFDESLLRYKPFTTFEISSTYVIWKTDASPEQIPELDKVHDQVLRAWKMIEARKLAVTQAKKYQAEAERDKASLDETFGKQPEVQVIKPPPFSWLTMGNVPRDPSGGRPRLAEISGVTEPGNELMQTVFELSPGGFAVASNHPETVEYVIHLLSFDRSQESLLEQFGSENYAMYRPVESIDLEQAYSAWVQHLMKDADVHWVRTAMQQRPPVGIDFGEEEE